MRFVLVGLLSVHGLIHLLGFVKAFEFAPVPQLKHAISRPVGALWLVAAVALVVAAVLVLAAPSAWWLAGVVGVVLSQALIVSSWSDARFGTVANVLLAVPLVVALAGLRPSSYPAVYASAVKDVLADSTPQRAVTEADLEGLPPVAATWLRHIGVVGQPRVQTFRAVWNTKLRQGPDKPWMVGPFEQVSRVDVPTRLFLMKTAMLGVPVDVLHLFREGHASMQVQAASLVTIVDARGPQMDRSETVTHLNDLCLMAPAALLDPRVTWTARDERSVTVTLDTGSQRVSAVLTFDEAGDLVDFVSNDRSKSVDGRTFENLPWSTPVKRHREVNGVRVAAEGEAVWHEPAGAWAYGTFELVSLEYNVGTVHPVPVGAPLVRAP
jgi:hypothetical protein